MTQRNDSRRVRWIVRVTVLLALGIAAVLALRGLTPERARTTPDSLHYLDAAANLRSGRGLVSSGGEGDTTEGYRPFTRWPPLYPWALAAVVGDDPYEATGLVAGVNRLLLALTVMLFAYLCSKLAEPVLAWVAVVAFAAHQTVLCAFSYVWSESLFLPLLLGSLALLTNTGEMPASSMSRTTPWRLYCAVVALVAAAYTRYLGAVLVMCFPLFAWLAGIARDRSSRKHVLLASGLGIVLLTPLAAWNLALTGALGGMDRLPSDRSLGQNLRDLWDVLRLHHRFDQLQWDWVVGALLVLVGLWLAWAARSARFASQDRNGQAHLAVLSGLYCLAYSVALLVLRSWKHFDPVDSRLLTPGLMLGFLALLLPSLLVGRSGARRALGTVLTAGTCVFFALVASVQIQQYRAQRAALLEGAPVRFALNQEFAYQDFTHHQVVRDLRIALRVIGGESPEPLHLVTDNTGLASFVVRAPLLVWPRPSESSSRLRVPEGRVLFLLFRGHRPETLQALLGPRAARLRVRSPRLLRHGILLAELPSRRISGGPDALGPDAARNGPSAPGP